MTTIKQFISPNFTHEKLETPSFEEIVDVFEDRMANWLLLPAKTLLEIPHGDVAAVALAINYIEGIEIYISGQDSKTRSREFFCTGFKRIFHRRVNFLQDIMHDAFAKALYDLLRCGFAHDAMFRYGITFTEVRKEAFTITWPKKNGEFDPNGQLLSAVINPQRFIEGVEFHFKKYLKELRSPDPTALKENFLAAVKLKWNLDESGPLIGMTEHQFLSGYIPHS
jgi:hypothetical protein